MSSYTQTEYNLEDTETGVFVSVSIVVKSDAPYLVEQIILDGLAGRAGCSVLEEAVWDSYYGELTEEG